MYYYVLMDNTFWLKKKNKKNKTIKAFSTVKTTRYYDIIIINRTIEKGDGATVW